MAGKKKDPLDDAGDEDSVVERDVEKLKALNEKKPSVTESRDDTAEPEVSVEEPEEPDVDDERPSRRERRSARGQDFVREAKESAEAARREAQELRERLARMEGQMSAQPKTPAADPHADEEKSLDAQQKGIYARYEAAKANKTLTQEMIDGLEGELKQVHRKSLQLEIKRMNPQQPAASVDEVAQKVRQQGYIQRHGDVIGNQRALGWAQGRMQQLVIGEGRPDNDDLVDEVMAEARQKFGMTPRHAPAPSQAQRSRLGGVSRGASAMRDDGPRTVRMDKSMQKMANAAFSHIKDPKKRLEMWARGTHKQGEGQ